MAISVPGCPLNKLMVLRAFLFAFMSLLLTFSIDLQTAFAHFCRTLLEGAGIFELKHIFLTLLGPMGVLLSPICSQTLAVAGFLHGFPVFISSYRLYNLYDEIKTGKPGRKPATANVGLNIGLSNTYIFDIY